MTTQQPAERSALVASLTDLYRLTRHIETRYEEKARIEGQFPPPQAPWKPWGWKGYAISIIGSLVVLSGLLPDVGILSLLIYPLWPAVGIGIPIVWKKVIVPRGNVQRRQGNREVAARMREATAGVDAELNEAGRVYATRFAANFPEAYAYSDAVAYCAKSVRDHRADTVGQAINLYETELHQQRLEQTQAQLLEEQQTARRQQAMQAVVGAALQGATIGAIRSEGAANRAAFRRR